VKSTGVENIQWVDPNQLHPSPKNPNKHPQEQIEKLAKILKYQGFRSPIVVSKQTGHIVVGHGRLMAAKLIAMEKVPVSYQDFESWDQEYAHMCADNAISEWATMDLSMVNAEIPNLGPIDPDVFGIEDFKIEPAELPQPKEKQEKRCPHCNEVL